MLVDNTNVGLEYVKQFLLTDELFDFCPNLLSCICQPNRSNVRFYFAIKIKGKKNRKILR